MMGDRNQQHWQGWLQAETHAAHGKTGRPGCPAACTGTRPLHPGIHACLTPCMRLSTPSGQLRAWS
eukprot:1159851-Pelagomonas_calceolata.AAC.5